MVDFYYVPLKGLKGAGKFFVIDLEDKDKIMAKNWFISTHGYAFANNWINGVNKPIFAHRLIMGANGRHQSVDHINHDILDNRKSNLRLCSHAENLRNTKKRCGAKTSRFKGVSFSKQKNKWRARVTLNGKEVNRFFGSEFEARDWYDETSVKLFGQFACPNVKQTH